MKRHAVNVYVPQPLLSQLQSSGLNLSAIARRAWAAELAALAELEGALGPRAPVAKLAKDRR